MIQWSWPWLFLLLPLPWLARRLLPPSPEPGGALRVPFFSTLSSRLQAPRPSVPMLALAVGAWLALLAGAARPQWIGESVTLPASGRDLMVAVDLSGSMETADLFIGGQAATRLQVIQAVLGEFLDRRSGDRVGLILFGRNAYLQTPLTFDLETTRTMLDEAVIGLAGKETAIGDAIGLAVKRLREQPHGQKVLILLTDGANTAGAVEPLKAAQLAAQEQIKIHAIGVGADELMVRSMFGVRRVNPSADLDEPTLRAISESTGGRYFRARDTEELVQIYTELDALEPVASDTETLRPRYELFYWPLLVAIALSLVILLLRLRPRRLPS